MFASGSVWAPCAARRRELVEEMAGFPYDDGDDMHDAAVWACCASAAALFASGLDGNYARDAAG
jgi:hypothetical protein